MDDLGDGLRSRGDGSRKDSGAAVRRRSVAAGGGLGHKQLETAWVAKPDLGSGPTDDGPQSAGDSLPGAAGHRGIRDSKSEASRLPLSLCLPGLGPRRPGGPCSAPGDAGPGGGMGRARRPRKGPGTSLCFWCSVEGPPPPLPHPCQLLHLGLSGCWGPSWCPVSRLQFNPDEVQALL